MMSNLLKTQYSLRIFDDFSRRGAGLSRLHPIVQITTTLIYLIVVVSFDATEISGLLPFILYPAILMIINEVPIKLIFSRLVPALPFILLIGILNPLFDKQPVNVGTFIFARGWLTFISIVVKGILTISSTLLLITSCSLAKLAKSLRVLKVPKFLVLQLLLTIRYLTVLLEEAARTITAYTLRAPERKGIIYKAWGSLLGQLFIRTFDRAERIYQAMCLRGFNGDYPDEPMKRIKLSEIIYGLAWTTYFLFARLINIPQLLGGAI